MRLFVSTRPFPGLTANGDAWAVINTPNGYRVAVIDGAGHGPEAAKASQAARLSLEASAQLPLVEGLKRCHTALHGTRGAVLSVLHVSDDGAMEFAGVGNVEGRIYHDGSHTPLPPARGLLGMVIPTVRPYVLHVTQPWVAVMFTDGVSQRFMPVKPPTEITGDPQAYVDEIIATWGRLTDDATVVLVLSSDEPAA
jgi:negative regulator of sigma-B (phosphoserine phosphatase)